MLAGLLLLFGENVDEKLPGSSHIVRERGCREKTEEMLMLC